MAADAVCRTAPQVDDDKHVDVALKLFRLWTAHPSVRNRATSSATEVEGPAEPASKAATWKSYYGLLSTILQQSLAYSPPTVGPERPQFAKEFRHVELMCETSLLREEKFPIANSGNPLVENWVEQVIQNWEVLCGPQWTEEDIGDGGQNGVSRHVLDVSELALPGPVHLVY